MVKKENKEIEEKSALETAKKWGEKTGKNRNSKKIIRIKNANRTNNRSNRTNERRNIEIKIKT